MEKVILFAIPIFFVSILAEYSYGIIKKRNTYRLNDALSSLSQGAISQLVALVTQLFQIGLYAWVYSKVALWPDAPFWQHWYGWVAAVLLFDFFDYWLHRMGHESAVMWAAHMVHHQSQDFNFSTALRQESTVAFIGWIFYLPMAVAGVPPEQFAAAGLIVLLYQFWIHTEHVGKLGWFDRVFSSPSNHRVHHAVNDHYLDKNYGGMLVIWDRMFGTFMEEGDECVYGTRVPLNSWDPLHAITGEYRQLWRLSRSAVHWPDKLRVWYKPPGWRPAALKADAPVSAPFDLEAARLRYDPPLGRRAALVAAAQFTYLLAASGACLWYADDIGYGSLLLLVVASLAGFWALGRYLERRMGGWRMALIDLALLGAMLAVAVVG